MSQIEGGPWSLPNVLQPLFPDLWLHVRHTLGRSCCMFVLRGTTDPPMTWLLCYPLLSHSLVLMLFRNISNVQQKHSFWIMICIHAYGFIPSSNCRQIYCCLGKSGTKKVGVSYRMEDLVLEAVILKRMWDKEAGWTPVSWDAVNIASLPDPSLMMRKDRSCPPWR